MSVLSRHGRDGKVEKGDVTRKRRTTFVLTCFVTGYCEIHDSKPDPTTPGNGLLARYPRGSEEKCRRETIVQTTSK